MAIPAIIPARETPSVIVGADQPTRPECLVTQRDDLNLFATRSMDRSRLREKRFSIIKKQKEMLCLQGKFFFSSSLS